MQTRGDDDRRVELRERVGVDRATPSRTGPRSSRASASRSWGEWDDRSARLAAAFKDLGLSDDGKVASYLYNSTEYMEGVFATWKCGAGPVNVNYRYLEDELAYLLTNSDTEILLFHGSLGEHVAKVAAQIPTLKAIVQVDDGSPLVEGALRYEDLIAAHEPAPRGGTTGDDLYILYTGGTTGMPKGVMWRNEDLFMSLIPFVYGIAGEALPDDGPAGAGAIAARVEEKGATPVHLPASPLMHGTGFMSSLQALTMGGTIVTLESRHFDADELWRAVERNGVTQMAIVGDAFGKPMVRALEQAEAEGQPYDLTTLGIIISSGVMWTAEVKEALMARAGLHLPRLARLERGRRVREPGQHPGRRLGDDREVPDRRARQGPERGRARDRARLRGDRPARARRPDPARLLQGPGEDRPHVPDVQRPALLDPRRLGPGRRRRDDRAARSRAACRSTPAARRSSRKRSRRP